MPIYRKKASEINAYRWAGEVKPITEPLWLAQAFERSDALFKNHSFGPPTLWVNTRNGWDSALGGDYIIRDEFENIYPCKAEAFEENYELARAA